MNDQTSDEVLAREVAKIILGDSYWNGMRLTKKGMTMGLDLPAKAQFLVFTDDSELYFTNDITKIKDYMVVDVIEGLEMSPDTNGEWKPIKVK